MLCIYEHAEEPISAKEQIPTENPLTAWDFTGFIDAQPPIDKPPAQLEASDSFEEEQEDGIPKEPSPEPPPSIVLDEPKPKASEVPKVEQRKPVPVESLFDRLERAERELKRDIFDTFETSPHKKLAELILDNELLKNRLRILKNMAAQREERG